MIINAMEIINTCLLAVLIVILAASVVGVWGALERKPEPPAQVINLVGLEGKRELGEEIMKYASRDEQRSLGRQIGPDIVLILPANFSREKLEYNAALNYDYLVEYGAYQGVTMRMAK